jgi:DNA polymerase-1
MCSTAWRRATTWTPPPEISGLKTITFEEVCGKGAKQITFNQVDVDRATEYSAEDADVTLQLHQALWPQIEAIPRLKDLYESIEQPLVPVLYRMERTGVLVDRELLRKQSGELAARMLELQAQAHAEAGGAFNVDSPKQLQEILFGKLGIPVMRKTPTGQPSTAEDVLEELAETHRSAQADLEYRGIAKLKSPTRTSCPSRSIRSRAASTPRIIKPWRPPAGCRRPIPNLQNIPIRTPRDGAFGRPSWRRRATRWWPPTIRKSNCASWRICRAMRACCAAFAEDRDVHQATAAEVFATPLERSVPINAAPPRPSTFG